ncbi:MAG: AarF/ABC1/UbiB kinase family protein [bacterium]|nr:AarF/ABC1/UbiB kinase family protein [bacterium]
MNQKLPEGKLARAKVAGAAVLKVGAGELQHKVKQAFLSSTNEHQTKQELAKKNAAILFGAMSQLRGTTLKIAQIIGMELDLLPASYQNELKKSFYQVPPLNKVLIRKVMIEQLGHSPEKLYASFDTSAFAAASLGQVHQAKLPDGTQLAVKVQYPGIGTAIDSDLAMVRSLVRKLRDAKIILQSLDEIEDRLKEEVNYRIERKNTNWFRVHVKLEGINIPRVYDEFSAQHVLTTQYMPGRHLDAWLFRNPSKQLRNRAAQTLYDFFVHSARDLQCLHADPNPGNYLFTDDGSLNVLDFGCVRHLSDHFTHVFPQLLLAYLHGDRQALVQAYSDIGMSFENLSPKMYEHLFRPFGAWVTEPFVHDSYDFGANKDYTKRGQELMMMFSQSLDSPDYVAKEFIFFNRTIYGLCKIFERMGASVRMRHHWVEEKEYTI